MMHAVVWIPDWPLETLRAYGRTQNNGGNAVYEHNKVTVVDDVAAQLGVFKGMKKRHAKSISPMVELLPRCYDLEIQNFDRVIRVCEEFISHVVVLQPGMLLFNSRGPVRMVGSQEKLADLVLGRLVEEIGCEAHIGFGEGTLCAVLAAYEDSSVKNTALFLDPMPLGVLKEVCFSVERTAQMTEFLNDLHLLGLRTLRDLKNLDRALLFSRFGEIAKFAISLLDLDLYLPEKEQGQQKQVTVERKLDTPVMNSESATFLARELGTELVRILEYEGYYAKELVIQIQMTNSQKFLRTWHLDAVDVPVIVDRVRWQIKMWLSEFDFDSASTQREPIGIASILLQAQNLWLLGHQQTVLWGREESISQSTHRAIHRIQTLVGQENTVVPRLVSKLNPKSAYVLEPWSFTADSHERCGDASWLGAIPEPWPGKILDHVEPICIMDARGHPCKVSSLGRFYCTEGCGFVEPNKIAGKRQNGKITQFSAPWLYRRQWWEEKVGLDQVWCEIGVEQGQAFLCVWDSQGWALVGEY
ncbi:Y-family DNA polymerase [Arcanobacterium ihumii]|uniref:Y-family DNA polymerase n=1 Tax=Arcanobacterium ihumii TaxID=2138162 RepID=UPI000F536938|nr:hypothetical protein [Arcanobacterium ihumii]